MSDENFEHGGELLSLAAGIVASSFRLDQYRVSFSISTHQIFDRNIQRFGHSEQLARPERHGMPLSLEYVQAGYSVATSLGLNLGVRKPTEKDPGGRDIYNANGFDDLLSRPVK